jgi:hypothetical protein
MQHASVLPNTKGWPLDGCADTVTQAYTHDHIKRKKAKSKKKRKQKLLIAKLNMYKARRS